MSFKEVKVILAARKSLIRYKDKLLVRKDTRDCYSVPMGAPHSTQVTDLVGLFLLSEFNLEVNDMDGGLYRDGLLLIAKNVLRGL